MQALLASLTEHTLVQLALQTLSRAANVRLQQGGAADCSLYTENCLQHPAALQSGPVCSEGNNKK